MCLSVWSVRLCVCLVRPSLCLLRPSLCVSAPSVSLCVYSVCLSVCLLRPPLCLSGPSVSVCVLSVRLSDHLVCPSLCLSAPSVSLTVWFVRLSLCLVRPSLCLSGPSASLSCPSVSVCLIVSMYCCVADSLFLCPSGLSISLCVWSVRLSVCLVRPSLCVSGPSLCLSGPSDSVWSVRLSVCLICLPFTVCLVRPSRIPLYQWFPCHRRVSCNDGDEISEVTLIGQVTHVPVTWHDDNTARHRPLRKLHETLLPHDDRQMTSHQNTITQSAVSWLISLQATGMVPLPRPKLMIMASADEIRTWRFHNPDSESRFGLAVRR